MQHIEDVERKQAAALNKDNTDIDAVDAGGPDEAVATAVADSVQAGTNDIYVEAGLQPEPGAYEPVQAHIDWPALAQAWSSQITDTSAALTWLHGRLGVQHEVQCVSTMWHRPSLSHKFVC